MGTNVKLFIQQPLPGVHRLFAALMAAEMAWRSNLDTLRLRKPLVHGSGAIGPRTLCTPERLFCFWPSGGRLVPVAPHRCSASPEPGR
jgi:hypothetical protein